jgi:hypothetical protein
MERVNRFLFLTLTRPLAIAVNCQQNHTSGHALSLKMLTHGVSPQLEASDNGCDIWPSGSLMPCDAALCRPLLLVKYKQLQRPDG